MSFNIHSTPSNYTFFDRKVKGTELPNNFTAKEDPERVRSIIAEWVGAGFVEEVTREDLDLVNPLSNINFVIQVYNN